MFEDDFRGTELDRRKWQIVYHGNAYWNGMFDWDRRGVVVRDGVLRLRAFRDGGRWKAGGISMGLKATGFEGFLGGQVDICARIPPGKGLGQAFLLWPALPGPDGRLMWPPEIDIVETPGVDKQRVMTTLHWQGPRGNGDDRYDARFTDVDATQWHTYSIVWDPGRSLEFYVDGRHRHRWTEHVPDSPMSIGLQAHVASANETWHNGPPAADAPDPYEVEVRYVRWLGRRTLAPDRPGAALCGPQEEGHTTSPRRGQRGGGR